MLSYISFSRRVYTFEKEDIIGENTSEKLELNAQCSFLRCIAIIYVLYTVS